MAILLLFLSFLLNDLTAKDLLYAESWKSAYPKPTINTVTAERIANLQQRIAPITQSCLASLEERLGKPWPRRKDGSPKRLKIELERDHELFEGAAVTSGMFFIGIKLKILPFINGSNNFEKTLCHEIVHAYYRFHMSYFKYSKVPRWLREGSAVYLAGQTFEKEKAFMLKKASASEIIFNGLEGEHSFDDYYEDALSFHAMDERDANRGADKFLQLILEGKSVEESLRQLWQLDKTNFLNEAKEFAAKRVTSKIDAEINPHFFTTQSRAANGEISLQVAYEFYRRELLARGLDFNRPESYAPLAMDLYSNLLLQALIASYQFKAMGTKAMGLLEFILGLGNASFLSAQQASLRYALAGIYEHNQHWQEALLQNMTIFHEHAEEAMLQRLIPLAIAESYFGLMDWREVLRWSKDRDFYHNSNRLELTLFRSIAHYRLGQEKDAFKLMRSLNANLQLPVKLRMKLDDFLKQEQIIL